ncbi:MAG: hypothetical protein KDA47_03460 [Planctomycetales bacterium]|nr:hypothetical protein [Planctomycetales bacterium]
MTQRLLIAALVAAALAACSDDQAPPSDPTDTALDTAGDASTDDADATIDAATDPAPDVATDVDDDADAGAGDASPDIVDTAPDVADVALDVAPDVAPDAPLDTTADADVPDGFVPFDTLSEYGFFVGDLVDQNPAPGVVPYTVASPLWADHAGKGRYFVLPPGTTATPVEGEGWTFPDGTIVIKTFFFSLDRREPLGDARIVETRLLVREDDDWLALTYQWNDEQTEATLVDKQGLDLDFAVTEDGAPRKQPWHYPSRTECMVCHSRAANFVLGPSTVQMNRTHDYGGFVDNQLRVLEHLGLLQVDATNDFVKQLREQLLADGLSDEEATKQVDWFRSPSDQRKPRLGGSQLAGATEHYPRLVDPYDESLALEQRARSYLHSNCAHCHIGAGGGNAQIDLAFATKLSDTKALDERPLHDTFGIDDPRIIAPGDPRRSVLLHRVSIRDRGQMPQLATTRPDAKAVKLIEQWIEHLAKPAAEPKPNAVGAKANGR